MILSLLAESTDAWGGGVVGALGGTGLGGAIAYYMLSRWSPNIEAAHAKQLLEQRTDLLALAQSQRDLAKEIVSVFANTQTMTVTDNQKALGEVKDRIDSLQEAAKLILDKIENDHSLQEELAKCRKQCEDFEKNYGSDLKKRRPPNNQSPGT